MSLIYEVQRGSGIIKLAKHINAKKVLEIGCLDGAVSGDILANTEVETLVCLDIAMRPNMKHFEGLFPDKLILIEDDSIKLKLQNYNELLEFVPYDLVIVDAGHTYENAKNDLNLGYNLLRNGGILVTDDYEYITHVIDGKEEKCGVIEATREFLAKTGEKAHCNLCHDNNLDVWERNARDREKTRAKGIYPEGCYWYLIKSESPNGSN